MVNKLNRLKINNIFKDIDIKSIILGAIIGTIISFVFMQTYEYFFETTLDRLIRENQKLITSNQLLRDQVNYLLLDIKYPDIPYAVNRFADNKVFNNDPDLILFRTAAIDGDNFGKEGIYTFLNAKVGVGEIEKKGMYFNFLLEPNKVHSVTYNIPGYIEDIDDIFVDKQLYTASQSREERIEIDYCHFTTICTYSLIHDSYTCIATDTETEQWITFTYREYDENHGYNTVRTLNPMYSYTEK